MNNSLYTHLWLQAWVAIHIHNDARRAESCITLMEAVTA